MTVRIVHNRLLGGWFIVRGSHDTPISGRFDSKEQARAHLTFGRMSAHELDEAVHDAKAEEAAAINNAGRAAQIEYLSGKQS